MGEFKESEHPRDKDGKFTDKGKENRYKKLYVSLQFFKNKNQKGNIEKRITNETALENMPKEIFGFGKGREKTAHHQNHIYELGYKNEKEYLNGAKEFWNNKNAKSYFNEKTQRYYKYDEKNKLFISVDNTGVLKTFFELDNKSFRRKVIQEKLYGL